jgi:phenylalanyl-tRNA synthetase beta chain
MKVSLKWIHEFVDVQAFFERPEVLGQMLTAAGLEVEDIQKKNKDLKHVVVGLILEKSAHPDAQKLSVCKVTTGEGVVHQIVCGAKNHKVDDKVVVALPGAFLPGGIEIKKAVLRGVESSGMLCSYQELGLPEVSDGIIILDPAARLGSEVATELGLDDVIFELKVTPNRADCLSHVGLAREISTLVGQPFKLKTPEPKLSAESTRKKIKLEVTTPDLCPKYTGRFIENVQVSESPRWLKQKLQSLGFNSINNVVDVTNFVMLELGQPLHAFDADVIKNQKITVGLAKAQEEFITLDGSKITLAGDELLIQDGSGGVCIAGVIGGKNSGVTQATKNVFLESAYFAPGAVRKSMRKHGISTDSGYRFSRGVDPSMSLVALNRATELLLQVAGGTAFSDHYDVTTVKIERPEIEITAERISEKMGYKVQTPKVLEVFKKLHLEVSLVGELIKVKPPEFRFDLETEMDLVEEFARIYGYEHIPESLPEFAQEPSALDANFVYQRRVSGVARSFGFSQSLNFCFVSEKKHKNLIQNAKSVHELGLGLTEELVRILNPLNEELNVMRSLLSLGLLQNCFYNFHQSQFDGNLFEIGKVFLKETEGKENSILENWNMGLISWGKPLSLWPSQNEPNVYRIKTVLESLGCKIKAIEKSLVPSFLHLGQAAAVELHGKRVGFIGSVHPEILEDAKIRVPVALCEIHLGLPQKKTAKYQSFSKYPIVERDLALVLKVQQSCDQVVEVIRKESATLLQDLKVFDAYTGDKLPKGFKSLAVRLRLQDKNGTLQDGAVNSLIDRVLNELKQKLDISPR